MFARRARCMDCDMIADWYAVDDGSSEEDLAAMKAIAPNIKWLDKPAGHSGHVASINTLLKTAAGYDYFVWMEDDWYFVRDEMLLSKAITVLQANQDVAQVQLEGRGLLQYVQPVLSPVSQCDHHAAEHRSQG